MCRSDAAPPPPNIVRAFGLAGDPRPLSGGDRVAWRVGDAVLKRVDVSTQQLEWQASLYERLQGRGDFRVPRLFASAEGEWSIGGRMTTIHTATWSTWRSS